MFSKLSALFPNDYPLDPGAWARFERVVAGSKRARAQDATGSRKKPKQSKKSPKYVVVLLCAGGMVGTDDLTPLGGRLVLAVDLRTEYLDAFGETRAVLWQKTRRQHILGAFATHDDTAGPFKIAASVQRGFYVPDLLYDVHGVGTFLGAAHAASNDLNLILGAVRSKYPGSKVVLMASPPCRMFSNANQRSCDADKREFLNVTLRLLRKMRWSHHLGFCDAAVIECSAPGKRARGGTFLPGRECQLMVDALNCVGKKMYVADKINAADYGAYSNRWRLFIAPAGAHRMLPDSIPGTKKTKGKRSGHQPPRKHRGWGIPLQVGPASHLRLVRGSWLNKRFAGEPPTKPGPTPTTHRLYVYPGNERRVTLVPVQRRGVLMGLRADDTRVPKLRAMPSGQRNTLTGITFCVQYYLGTLAATAGHLGCFPNQREASRAFWRYENRRHATHPAPQGALAARRYKLEAERLEGWLDDKTYYQRYARLYK